MGVKIYLLIATFPGTGVEQVYEQAFPVSGQGGLLWPQSSVRSGHTYYLYTQLKKHSITINHIHD